MKPILMTTEMVKATLEDRKTQTRRVIKSQPFFQKHCNEYWFISNKAKTAVTIDQMKCLSPYGKIGDKLWVRETYTIDMTTNNYNRIVGRYLCDNKNFGINLSEKEIIKYSKWKNKVGKKSKLIMFKSLSRITLEITDIRVERVQDISGDDCRKEGITFPNVPGRSYSLRLAFMRLWDSIYKKRGYGWKVNPWVWVVEFKKLEA